MLDKPVCLFKVGFPSFLVEDLPVFVVGVLENRRHAFEVAPALLSRSPGGLSSFPGALVLCVGGFRVASQEDIDKFWPTSCEVEVVHFTVSSGLLRVFSIHYPMLMLTGSKLWGEEFCDESPFLDFLTDGGALPAKKVLAPGVVSGPEEVGVSSRHTGGVDFSPADVAGHFILPLGSSVAFWADGGGVVFQCFHMSVLLDDVPHTVSLGEEQEFPRPPWKASSFAHNDGEPLSIVVVAFFSEVQQFLV